MLLQFLMTNTVCPSLSYIRQALRQLKILAKLQLCSVLQIYEVLNERQSIVPKNGCHM